jgi:multiple sugar transport system ATP-binding protein
MSISDEIVVMKLGVEQQRAHPQEVYNNPINKFVANFLGTPPINFFKGEIKDGAVLINGETVLTSIDSSLENQEVVVGIRPEGFEVDPNGTFHVSVENIETLGRDISIVAKHVCSERPTVKIIIDADTEVGLGNIALSVKPHKCFVFNKDTEERLV